MSYRTGKRAFRCLIVFDGEYWFSRKVRSIEHDTDRDEKVYRCDEPIGGPYKTIEQAVTSLHIQADRPAQAGKEGKRG